MKHVKTLAISALVVGTVITSSAFAFDYAKKTNTDPLASSAVTKVLQEKGITAPTSDEMKAFMEKMQSARDAEEKLSDADKSGLQTLRDGFRKQERDYLRSKGVTLPSEEEISKMDAVHEALRSQMGELRGAFRGMGMGKEMMNGKSGGCGMMGDGQKNGNQKSERKGKRGGIGAPTSSGSTSSGTQN